MAGPTLYTTFENKIGQITIDIIDNGDEAFFTLESIGEIKYKFDITPENTNIDRVSVLYQSLDIQIRHLDSIGRSIYDRLRNNLGTDKALVTLDIKTWTGETWKFRFEFLMKNVSLSEKTNKMVINLQPIKPTKTMGEYFVGKTTMHYEAPLNIYDCVSVGTFIRDFISLLNPSLSNEVSNVARTTGGPGGNPTDPLYAEFNEGDISTLDGETAVVIVNLPNSTFEPVKEVQVEDIPMINIATSLAACEGSLFGTGFDKNFWIYRANLGTPIEVDYNDCLDLEFDYGYESLRRIFIQFKGKVLEPSSEGFQDFSGAVPPGYNWLDLNQNAEKEASLYFNLGHPHANTGFITDTGSGKIVMGGVKTVSQLQEAALNSYRLSFQAENRLRIKGKFRGFKVKPWQSFKFTSNAPTRYQNKTYRLTTVSYNIEIEEMSYEAYEIPEP